MSLAESSEAPETPRGGSPHPPREGCSAGPDAASMRDGYGDPPRTQPRGKRSEGRSVRCRTRPESRLGRAFYGACQQAARVLFITFFGIRADHRERLPRRGGVLVISNHQSFLDPILAAVGMPRPFHPMARETLFRVAPFRWIIRSLYAFPVRPGSADLGAIREALRRLGSGAVVLMFPEGTRTRDGSIGRLQAGPVMLAARGGVPIVPMVIDGAFEAWPRTHLLPWPHRIRVALGEPILLPDDKGLDAEAVMEEIHRRMVELQAELRRGR